MDKSSDNDEPTSNIHQRVLCLFTCRDGEGVSTEAGTVYFLDVNVGHGFGVTDGDNAGADLTTGDDVTGA